MEDPIDGPGRHMQTAEGPSRLCDLHRRYAARLPKLPIDERNADPSLALSAFVDLYLAIYPSVVLWRLQITLGKKLALCAALGLGGV